MPAKKTYTTRAIPKKRSNNVRNRDGGFIESAIKGSNRARSAVARVRSNDRRAAARKPAPYGRGDDGWPKLGPRGTAGSNRGAAAKRRSAAKKRKGISA